MEANILHLQNYLNLSCGISRSIYLIAKNTSAQFNHYAICFGGDGLSRFEDINLKLVILKKYKHSSFGLIINFFKLFAFCKKNKIDVIHSHHRYFDLLAFLISKFRTVSTVTTIHSKVINKKLFSYKSDILIACSNVIKNHLIKNFKINENRVQVMYNFVDPSDFNLTKSKTKIMNELNIPDNKFIFGYFGRLDYKEKGLDILLESLKILSVKKQNLFLLLIGNGENKSDIKLFINNYNLNATVLDARNDIYNFYQVIDVFVLPSRTDPFPLVMLEAGYAKVPLIASNVDGIPELIENGKDGLLFESENVNDLSNKLCELIENKDMGNNLAEELHRKIIKLFITEKIIPNYIKLYSDVVRKD